MSNFNFVPPILLPESHKLWEFNFSFAACTEHVDADLRYVIERLINDGSTRIELQRRRSIYLNKGLCTAPQLHRFSNTPLDHAIVRCEHACIERFEPFAAFRAFDHGSVLSVAFRILTFQPASNQDVHDLPCSYLGLCSHAGSRSKIHPPSRGIVLTRHRQPTVSADSRVSPIALPSHHPESIDNCNRFFVPCLCSAIHCIHCVGRTLQVA